MNFELISNRWIAGCFFLLICLPSLGVERLVQTVEAVSYTLPQKDPFLAPFQGTDLEGIEDVVAEIEASRALAQRSGNANSGAST